MEQPTKTETRARPIVLPERCDQCGRDAGSGHVHWIDLTPRCTGERFAFCGVSCLRDHAEEMMGD